MRGWPEPPEERYTRDPVFRNLVDMLEVMLEQDGSRTWTPTELREAVILAACRYEYRRIRPIVVNGHLYYPQQEGE